MDKIKVLVIPRNKEARYTHRVVKPHLHLQEKYGEDFFIDIDFEPQLDNDEWLKQYDIIIYHEYLDEDGSVVNKFKELGITSVLDITDNWTINKNFQLYKYMKHQEEQIKDVIRNAENITTSTPAMYDKLKSLVPNANVMLLVDGINTTESQYKQETKSSKRLRFGWTGDIYTYQDIKILTGVSSKLKSDKLLDKVQFVLCGFDLDSYKTRKNEVTGEDEKVRIDPKETAWYEYERILTNNYTTISEEYKKHLLKFENTEFEGVEDEPYRRVWSKPSNKHGEYYSEFDVTLAPMSENDHSAMNSPFKVMESGMYGKPIIAQDFGPYRIDLVNGYMKGGLLDLSANSLMVETRKNHKDWYKYMKKLILEQDAVETLGNNLHKTVKDKYSMDTITDTRAEYYKTLK